MTELKDDDIFVIAQAIKEMLSGHLRQEERLATFKDWPFDSLEGALCKSEQLAKYGFKMTVMKPEAEEFCAECVWCQKELYFEASDEPSEDGNHLKCCPLLLVKKPEEEWSFSDAYNILLYIRFLPKAKEYLAENIHQYENASDETRKRINNLLVKAEREGRQ